MKRVRKKKRGKVKKILKDRVESGEVKRSGGGGLPRVHMGQINKKTV